MLEKIALQSSYIREIDLGSTQYRSSSVSSKNQPCQSVEQCNVNKTKDCVFEPHALVTACKCASIFTILIFFEGFIRRTILLAPSSTASKE